MEHAKRIEGLASLHWLRCLFPLLGNLLECAAIAFEAGLFPAQLLPTLHNDIHVT